MLKHTAPLSTLNSLSAVVLLTKADQLSTFAATLRFALQRLALPLLYPISAMTFAPSQLIGSAILGYLTTLSLMLVGYLVVLEIRDFRRNRRMQAQRKRLGLHHA